MGKVSDTVLYLDTTEPNPDWDTRLPAGFSTTQPIFRVAGKSGTVVVVLSQFYLNSNKEHTG